MEIVDNLLINNSRRVARIYTGKKLGWGNEVVSESFSFTETTLEALHPLEGEEAVEKKEERITKNGVFRGVKQDVCCSKTKEKRGNEKLKERRKKGKEKRGAPGINIYTYIHVQDVSQNVEYNNQYEA